MKEGFVLRKEKVYLLSRKKKGSIHELIEEQLMKEYTRPLMLPQIALVFFVVKKNGKKYMV